MEFYPFLFLKTENNYRLLGSGSYVLQTFNPKIAILRDSHSGWIDIAMPNFSFNPFEYDKVKGWITYKFNGTEYANSEILDSINYQTIVDFENAKTFNLAASGLATSQNTTALNNTASSIDRVTIPDSFDLVFDNNGMKSKLVKGSDGYYTWYLTNYFVPRTCLGLREHEDPTKVQVKMYGCNSKKKARKWEIVMTDDNTGYKIKLPNTNYCLGYDKGIFDCDSPEAQVEKLSPEQLKSWRSKR